jgi:Domain of unknown function (DUF6457)
VRWLLEEWMDEVAAELGVEPPADADEILDVARVVAHEVERRAAPVTAYLMGLAAAGRPGQEALAEIARSVVALARRGPQA